MQSLPTWETEHFQRNYQEKGIDIGYKKGNSLIPGITGSYKYKKNLH